MKSGKFIILRKIKYAESDLILHALSSEGEKLSFLARGALKSKKRFGGGVLEPLHFCEFHYRISSGEGKLNILNEAGIINDFPGLRSDYERLSFGLKILESVSKVSLEGDTESTRLFQLIGHALSYLEQTENLEIFQLQFYLKFLLQQGVLSAEPWMVPFIKTSLQQSSELIGQPDIPEKMMSAQKHFESYLANAETYFLPKG